MDFDLRQWLLILGPIFIVAVLLHGYFRMRSGRNDIKMKLDRSFLSDPGEEHDVDELSMFKAELPNGGARVIENGARTVVFSRLQRAPLSRASSCSISASVCSTWKVDAAPVFASLWN